MRGRLSLAALLLAASLPPALAEPGQHLVTGGRGGGRCACAHRHDQVPQLRGHFDSHLYPGAAKLAEQLLTIPTHHWVEERDRKAIANCFPIGAVPPLNQEQSATSFEPVHHV